MKGLSEMNAIMISLTTIKENVDGNPTRKTIRRYKFKDCTKDDVLEWFEDKYRDDSPMEKNWDGTYLLTRATSSGFTTYCLKFIEK